MKSLTVRLPDEVMALLEAESKERHVSVSDVVRERITAYRVSPSKPQDTFSMIQDLCGSVEGLPKDLSSRTKHYLKKSGYGAGAR
jgi:hypothetical protein